ncbi:MAG: hypothetical protein NC092_11425 [Butyrivibrio sp.]|nr:hypothetical protein [Muribaculum sp.]MCM1090364.1 hypothetical protein [Muribaculum sp.]MCM1090365.1 hypothetical protein [Muribaculum sp.]MCM1553292.1 hypothetical protein [Butyrivibrio sp.]
MTDFFPVPPHTLHLPPPEHLEQVSVVELLPLLVLLLEEFPLELSSVCETVFFATCPVPLQVKHFPFPLQVEQRMEDVLPVL